MSANDIISGSVGQTGSPANVDPAAGAAAGQSTDTGASQGADYKAQYEELERKMGAMGKENGDYRTFFKSVEPLLTKLDEQPELITAILAGKIDASLAKAAMEGKVTLGDAAVVTAAHEQIKKDLGTKKYEAMAPDQMEKLITEKATKIAEEIVSKRGSEDKSLREFEDKTVNFVESTPDFEKYAELVEAWLNDHSDIDDIETAYYAVKGKVLEEAIKAGDEDAIREAAKEMALNVSGGGSVGGALPSNTELVDQLIAGRSNPNDL